MTYQTTNPAGARELLNGPEEWTYLDVRSEEEFQAGHVPGAFNVPLLFRTPQGMAPNPAFVEAVKRSFPASSRLVVGCAAGGRSRHACELLAAEGYASLANMHGGFSGAHDESGAVTEPGWEACGFETTTAADPERAWKALSGQ